MPFGLKRFQQAEALHFITFSCFHRLPYLQQPEPKSTLEPTRARHQARIYAYVFMPEHVHLLINEPPAILLSQFLKSFKQSASASSRAAAISSRKPATPTATSVASRPVPK